MLPKSPTSVIPAQGDLCTTVIPAKAGIQWGGCLARMASVTSPNVGSSGRLRKGLRRRESIPGKVRRHYPGSSLSRGPLQSVGNLGCYERIKRLIGRDSWVNYLGDASTSSPGAMSLRDGSDTNTGSAMCPCGLEWLGFCMIRWRSLRLRSGRRRRRFRRSTPR